MARRRRTLGDLGYHVGAQWSGFRFEADGLFYCPSWRRGFTPGELVALFWRCQQVAHLEASLKRLQGDLERASAIADELESQRDWYRHQLVLEARLGLALARITAS